MSSVTAVCALTMGTLPPSRRNRWRASCWETSPRGSDRRSLEKDPPRRAPRQRPTGVQGHPGLAGPGIFVHSRMPDGFVILTAKPIADRGAEGERRNSGQDDLDAADVLDLDSWPGTDTSLGHLTVRNPARGHARERCGEADIRDQTPRPQEDTAARSAHPSPRITLSDEAAERERAHSRRSVCQGRGLSGWLRPSRVGCSGAPALVSRRFYRPFPSRP